MGQLSENEIPSAEKPPEVWLDSWKEIAAYLNRDVTTAQRWEKREAMPVHRHVHDKRGSVYALTGELDAWIESRSSHGDEPEKKPEAETLPQPASNDPTTLPVPASRLWVVSAVVVCTCLLAVASWVAVRHRNALAVQPKIRSLAVLPLRNLSADPAQDYLADGITEALISRLSNNRDLRVTSHTSVIRFKDPQLSTSEIARTLGVDAVVEGSVIREGDHIRVTAQLIRAATDENLWSETYDREMRDALGLESELALAIGEKVEATVTGEEHQRLSTTSPVAPEVYESYLKGMYVLEQGNTPGVQQSIPYFEDALNKDATFAPAYVGLAKAYFELGTVFAGGRPETTRPKVTSYARKALALDPDIVEAHTLLANVLQEEWQWTEAEAEYRRALELNPNNADANAGLALWLVCEGRAAEADDSINRARALDPIGISGANVAVILFHSHRYEDAIRESRATLAIHPDDGQSLLQLGFALIAADKPADAIPILEKAIALSPGSPAATGALIRAYAHAGRRSDAIRLLADLKRRRETTYIPAGAFVNAYLGLDDNEQAFYWLEQAYNEHSNILQFLKTHPFFDPIRADPRFVDLVRRVGLS